MKTPPYRIQTERLAIRCWNPADAILLDEAVVASLEHLRPWMPWIADEPRSLDERVELLRTFRARFDADEDFVYGIFERGESRVIGGTGLHTRLGEDALEIGYWIRADAGGQGLATEATAALTRVAFEICAVDRVEIRVEPANERSVTIPRKLGFTEEATLRRRLPAPGGEPRRDVIIFTMLAEELSSSPCADAQLNAYDAAGRVIQLPG